MGKPRIFKSKWFERFARKERIAVAALRDAVARAERGQIDADLGAGVIKQRIARPAQGKSAGYRAIILFRQGLPINRLLPKRSRARQGAVSSGTPMFTKNHDFFAEHRFSREWFFNRVSMGLRRTHRDENRCQQWHNL